MAGKMIRVTGKGKISVKPDRIRLYITKEELRKEYEATIKASTDNTEFLKDLFANLGFNKKDLKTIYFNVDTEYENYQSADKSWKNRFKGYKYTHRMKIEFASDNRKLGQILYALSHCRVKPEFSIEYTVADKENAKNELLGRAVKDSMEKASVLAEASGVKLGNILSIDYSWGEVDFVSRPLNEMALKCCEADAGAPDSYDIDIEPDDIDMTDTVTVVWEIGD